MEDTSVDVLPQLGVCNLCLSDGAVLSMLSVQHTRNGVEELYSEMLLKCFNIDIMNMHLGDTKQVICDQCVLKLRETAKFKELVEASLRTLEDSIQALKEEISNDDLDVIDYESDNKDDLKSEFDCEATDLISYLIKEEDEDSRMEKKKVSRKASSKSLGKVKYKKPKVNAMNTEDCRSMLQRGLFPFKTHKNGYSCSICPEKVTSLDSLKDHVLEHRSKNIQIAFRKSAFVSRSRFFFMNNLNLGCKICAAEVNSFSELKDHLGICPKMSTNKDWRNGLPFKLEKDQLDCPVCKKTFLNFVNLNTHMNMHYPNYICENCGKAFASKNRLRAHMRTHEVGVFPCKVCGAVFDKVTKRENHVSKEHKSGVRYACKRCNITLPSFYARQKHLADVHNEDLKKYKCNACSQSYVTPGHLSSHVRRDHLNERNYQCNKCDLAFYTGNSLKMHMIKHDGERIHSCAICQKSYQRKKTLREHMRIHNNDKRFVCPFCGRAFTQKCTLKGHLKVHDRKPDIGIDNTVTEPLQSI